MKTDIGQHLDESWDSIRDRLPFRPEIALVLGSGLGPFADQMDIKQVIPYREIVDVPVSTVDGHKGQYVFGRVGEKRVIAMQGRLHYYEGYSMEEVVGPIRLMRRMGAETLLLTNAAGGLHEEWKSGTLMVITDQIASFVPSPLIGPNEDSIGERFPDMSHIYDPALREILLNAGEKLGIPLQQGVYLQMTGPQYESPAEVRMCRMLGADAVGMSTACEAIAARHCGFRIGGISCITNPAAGISKKPLSHTEVQEAANRISEQFSALVRETILRI